MSWPAFMYLHSKMRMGMGEWCHVIPGYQCQYNKSWSFLLTSVQCIWEWELIMSRNSMKNHDFPLWCWPQCSVYLFLILLNIEVKQYICFHPIYLVSTNTFLGIATDPCSWNSLITIPAAHYYNWIHLVSGGYVFPPGLCHSGILSSSLTLGSLVT